MAVKDEIGDIQAIVDRGFGSLGGASFLLARVSDRASARAWLRSLPVTSIGDAQEARLSCVCQVAFTASGLIALGHHPDDAGGFAPEFLDGMAGNKRRSCQLGDEGDNSPENWDWGVGSKEPHILLMLLAPFAEIAALEGKHVAALRAAGCELVCANRSNGVLGHEPFGFADGLSQPEPDWEGTLVTGSAKDRVYRNCIAAGEFLLGHPNEYGFVTDYPRANEVGRNGSYLVYRQLAQDVRRFWKWLADHAGTISPHKLAEMMVGRGLDGDPLDGLGASGPKNAFTYANDPDGIACPVGAHIRRANPRTGDDPQGHHGFVRDIIASLGFTGTVMHDAVASSRFHRILRRGRAYGPVIDIEEAMSEVRPDREEEAGLHFICLNASLARQFEFVQGAWVASAYFGGLSCEQDALLGNRRNDNGGRATDSFSCVDESGCPRIVTELPQFITVKGGAYFFLPGISGLARILAD